MVGPSLRELIAEGKTVEPKGISTQQCPQFGMVLANDILGKNELQEYWDGVMSVNVHGQRSIYVEVSLPQYLVLSVPWNGL